MINKGKIQYIVKKFVMARSASEAIKNERNVPVHDVFVDGEWAEGRGKQLTDAIGFQQENEDE